ncbi:MAG TPA: DUF5666 domain-containing protein [Candidatus Acidoferrales bacterium]|nr:DUF5666 domain-containing protein [Candidatus Acidoferrales bacterium]
MDFDVNSSIQSGDLSITPSVTLTQLPAANMLGQNDHEDDMQLVGKITGTDQTNQSFTLQTGMAGMTANISTTTNTEFDFEDSCSANNFSCLQSGAIVRVEVQQGSNGSLTATEVELFSPMNEFALRGTVTSVNAPGNSFQIVVFDDEAFTQQQMQGVSVGIALTVDVAPQATFAIDTNGISLPSGLSFASLTDMMAGQAVRVHPNSMMPSGTPPNITITADQVELVRSDVTATITAINASGTPPMFTLGSLPPLFSNAGVSSIQVDVLSTTEFESDDDAMMNVTGIGSLTSGNIVSAGGLLFNTGATPTLVAEKVDLRH